MKIKKAFTRVDFIVVLCCVVFLLVTLGTIGASGRSKAKQVVCLSNLKKLGDYYAQYLADNGGYFGDGMGNYNDKWANSLRPYYVDDNLRVCPSATRFWWKKDGIQGQTPYETNLDSPFAAWGKFIDYLNDPDHHGDAEGIRWSETGIYGSFGSNSWIYNHVEAQRGTHPNSLRYWTTINVAGADNIPMLLDCLHIGGKPHTTDNLPNFNGDWTRYGGGPGGAENAMGRFMMDRHDGGIQGVFFDLSARKIGVKEVGRLKWHREYDTSYFGPGFAWPSWMSEYPYE
jgi:hypothetical protein